MDQPPAVQQDKQLAIPSTSAPDIEVMAETPDEMKASNLALIEWCSKKITSMQSEYDELEEAHRSAVKKKWKASVLHRHALLAKRRIEFYSKMKTALEAGFFIVPNFPVNVFAIRTNKSVPLKMITMAYQTPQPWARKEQQTETLKQGEGDYVNPNPQVAVKSRAIVKDGKPTIEWATWATDWEDVDFPICMAKPKIMEAVGRAMEIKMFDDFGILTDQPDRRRGCGDPIIVGRIRDPRPVGWGSRKYISFIIAWSLDTRTI